MSRKPATVPSQAQPHAPRFRRRSVSAVFFAALLTLSAGCDQSFEPFAEHERYFSIYGNLDPAADTQWVRVMPIRTSTLAEPVPIDATVTLEHLGTGEVFTLRDSLFRHTGADPQSPGEVYVHTFWTTEPILPDATYRLTALRSDGATATATAKVAREYPRVIVGLGQDPRQFLNRDYVQVEGIDHLAMVLVHHYIPDECSSYSHPHTIFHGPDGRPEPGDDIARVYVDRRPVLPPGTFRCSPELKKQISIVTSGSEWAYGAELTNAVVTLPDVVSNVVNGAGFLGGILTRRVPYERCAIVDAASTDVCELVYDPESAAIEGLITDATCSHLPVFGALVRLEETDGPRIRETRTDSVASSSSPSGYYQVAALEPGITYSLEAGTTMGLDDLYAPYETSITLAPGERRTVEIPLQRQRDVNQCA